MYYVIPMHLWRRLILSGQDTSTVCHLFLKPRGESLSLFLFTDIGISKNDGIIEVEKDL